NLFQPSITLNLVGTPLSKIGDTINYTVTLNNTSSADTPNLVCTISFLGVNTPTTLASGASKVVTASHTVVAGDPDPFVASASASCSPTGFPNVLTASKSFSTNLFQPSVKVTKSIVGSPSFVQVGQTITYSFTITNTSSADSPNLILASVTD